jgi:hypothetical protein
MYLIKNAGLMLNPALIYSNIIPINESVSKIWSNLTFEF